MRIHGKIRNTLAASLLALAACGTTGTAPGQMAMGPRTSDVPITGVTPAVYRPGARIPDQVLHDPAQRFALMERLRVQVVSQTRGVPEPRWRNEVRPSLRHQLEKAGLARADVDFLLWEIDQAKASDWQ